MCYSFRTSIISYTLGMASGVFALCTRQWVLGSLILAYSQMQLSEAMIWHGIDKNDMDWNKKGTKYGQYLLATHNIAIGLGIILSIIFISKRSLTLKDFIPVIVGVIFFLAVVFLEYMPRKFSDVTFPDKQTCDNKCQSPENRLKWPFPHTWYLWSYLISVILIFIYVKPNQSKFLILVAFSVSFLVSALIYPHTVGSVWCNSTAFLAPMMVMVNYYMIRNVPDSELCT